MATTTTSGSLGGLQLLERGRLKAVPAFFDLLEALSVRWLILPSRIPGGRVEHVASVGNAEVYRLPAALPRARVVEPGPCRRLSRPVRAGSCWSGAIDLRREVVLHEPAAADIVAGLALAESGPRGEPARPSLVVDRATEVVVEATAPRGGLLLLADTWYPGWEATVDGRPTPVLRADFAHRAVYLPPASRPGRVHLPAGLSWLPVLRSAPSG